MKRILIALSAASLLGLAACGDSSEETTVVTPEATETVAPLPVETADPALTDPAMTDETATDATDAAAVDAAVEAEEPAAAE